MASLRSILLLTTFVGSAHAAGLAPFGDGAVNHDLATAAGGSETAAADSIRREITAGQAPLPSRASTGGASRAIDASRSRSVGARGTDAYAVIPLGAQTQVAVTDLRINSVVRRQAGQSPYGVAFSQTGRHAYVTNRGTSDVSFIDLLTGQSAAPVPVGFAPAGIAMGRDDKRLYVANEDDGTVSVVNVAQRRVQATLALSGKPHDVAVAANGSEIYVLDREAAAVAIIDEDLGEIDGRVTVAVPPFSAAADLAVGGTQIYVLLNDSDENSALAAIDSATREVRTISFLHGRVSAFAVDSSGAKAYVAAQCACWSEGRLYTVGLDDGRVIDAQAVERGISALSLTADERFLYAVFGEAGKLAYWSAGSDPRAAFTVDLNASAAVEGGFLAAARSMGVTWTPSPLLFHGRPDAAQAMTLTLANQGLYPVTVTDVNVVASASADSPSAFRIRKDACSQARVAPDATCTVEIEYEGTAGQASAGLSYTLISSAPGAAVSRQTGAVALLGVTPSTSAASSEPGEGGGGAAGWGWLAVLLAPAWWRRVRSRMRRV